jgi:hypothetical protein
MSGREKWPKVLRNVGVSTAGRIRDGIEKLFRAETIERLLQKIRLGDDFSRAQARDREANSTKQKWKVVGNVQI